MTRKRWNKRLKKRLFVRTANKTKKPNLGACPQRGGFRF